ncbi:MAG: glucose-6-phosphate dehydrogenase [Phycisphaerae bacterium]|nr:glucose-6-phosphate dehydrogenase [Phycisphaerae bacterium]
MAEADGGKFDEMDLEAFEPRDAPPCLFVLYGATGDLAARKIGPALYNLAVDGLLPENFAVISVARRPFTHEEHRAEMRKAIEMFSRRPLDEDIWGWLAERWCYEICHAREPAEYDRLNRKLAEYDQQYGTCGGRLIYVAMLPELLGDIIDNVGRAGINQPSCEGGWVRLIVEKPFGDDLKSARTTNDLLSRHFDEQQVYRIDHFLGKETVQNILVLRFANSLFEPHLNARRVESVQISTTETVGMENRRGPYYEKTGALRDMVQNHMLQMLALVTMDQPDCLRCGAIRDAKARLLQQIPALTPEEVARFTARGQYTVGGGKAGYRAEDGVAGDSQTETFAAVRLTIDTDRWRGVPFYLRTGKRLAKKASEIVITFRRAEHELFLAGGCDLRGANRLRIRITPDEGVAVHVDAKVPGVAMRLRPVTMDYSYGGTFESASPEAYEHLVLDAMAGDNTLFIRSDEVEAAWRIVDSIRRVWDKKHDPPIENYEGGSWGPPRAEAIFEDRYTRWLPL